jgi:hypothetical protein
MPRTTRELLRLQNTGHAGINALFSKAHSMDWDIDRDVDWSLAVAPDDPCVDPSWAPFGRTPTFRALPRPVQVAVTRAALGRMLNILQVGESVAQDVCARLALLCPEEDYRNHAVAQAMDEARHHLAYVRFLARMGGTPEPVDGFTEAMFDELLGSEDRTYLIAGEQFFLESLAMPLFERLAEKAVHPLLRDIVTLINRDESRHVAFGVLYVAEYLEHASREERLAFARRWLPRILGILSDRGPGYPRLTMARLRAAGVDDAEAVALRMAEEQRELDRDESAEASRRVPHLLTSARRAGLLAPDLLGPLGLADHPLVRSALHDDAG